MKLCVATRNPHKLEEIRAILSGLPFDLVSAAELDAPDVEEDRPTLRGNAEKKALEVAAFTGLLSVADDTGLCVDALDGAPGVLSARFAGPEATYADNNTLLLAKLEAVAEKERTARFRTVIALARPGRDGSPAEVIATCEGALEGRIGLDRRGEHGFGYDPIFVVTDAGASEDGGPERTLAELPAQEKNAISHRGRALASLREILVAQADQLTATAEASR
ncbi:MAG: RdgB/HAM1 family non-canonical purine NTP pyrophosphatase [Planctomycetota bacterium]